MRSLALAVFACCSLAAQDVAVLGGSCSDNPAFSAARDLAVAKKARDWPRVVELQRLEVRASCGNAYRWTALVDALLKAKRRAEAIRVLDEMDRRGFDLNPSTLEAFQPDVAKFLDTPVFKRSRVGGKIERLRRISDARRARFAERLAKMRPDAKPPDQYVARPACPFECCQFGPWKVLADTDLVAAPDSNEVVARARKGTQVTAITGEVHLRPEPIGVLMDQGPLKKNSIVFVLDYLGEGFANVWTAGKVEQVEFYYVKYCFRPGESCWGEQILPSEDFKNKPWWVKIRLRGGVVGWTDKTQNFGGKDRCG